ncbi:G protein-regulated inducer of neurite outgrowth 1-like [Pollicipes pollicipes]|uniref:G protein-regulated inducer of neurite outgrowth 1-like n=1 Tax=Pollicipes pollicipes TaxID=41117 RepID=UPI00188501A2|nr:G protein-regulated inducer of neurite outgrowth 1-like [Pollicipes pollicipes]
MGPRRRLARHLKCDDPAPCPTLAAGKTARGETQKGEKPMCVPLSTSSGKSSDAAQRTAPFDVSPSPLSAKLDRSAAGEPVPPAAASAEPVRRARRRPASELSPVTAATPAGATANTRHRKTRTASRSPSVSPAAVAGKTELKRGGRPARSRSPSPAASARRACDRNRVNALHPSASPAVSASKTRERPTRKVSHSPIVSPAVSAGQTRGRADKKASHSPPVASAASVSKARGRPTRKGPCSPSTSPSASSSKTRERPARKVPRPPSSPPAPSASKKRGRSATQPPEAGSDVLSPAPSNTRPHLPDESVVTSTPPVSARTAARPGRKGQAAQCASTVTGPIPSDPPEGTSATERRKRTGGTKAEEHTTQRKKRRLKGGLGRTAQAKEDAFIQRAIALIQSQELSNRTGRRGRSRRWARSRTASPDAATVDEPLEARKTAPAAVGSTSKIRSSAIVLQTDEELCVGMYKVLEAVKAHEEAWPFLDPVEEEYAPNYYAVIRRPMDLNKLESRLDAGVYVSRQQFEADFKLIVDNCKLYNGLENEYTGMVVNIEGAFHKAVRKYLDTEEDEEEIFIDVSQVPVVARRATPRPAVGGTTKRRGRRSGPEATAGHGRKKVAPFIDYSDDELLASPAAKPPTREDTERLFDDLLRTASSELTAAVTNTTTTSSSSSITSSTTSTVVTSTSTITAAGATTPLPPTAPAARGPDVASEADAYTFREEPDELAVRRPVHQPNTPPALQFSDEDDDSDTGSPKKAIAQGRIFAAKMRRRKLAAEAAEAVQRQEKPCPLGVSEAAAAGGPPAPGSDSEDSGSWPDLAPEPTAQKRVGRPRPLFSSRCISKEESAKLGELISRVRESRGSGTTLLANRSGLTMGKVLGGGGSERTGEEAWEEMVVRRLKAEPPVAGCRAEEADEPLRLIAEPTEGRELPVLRKTATPNLSAWFHAFSSQKAAEPAPPPAQLRRAKWPPPREEPRSSRPSQVEAKQLDEVAAKRAPVPAPAQPPPPPAGPVSPARPRWKRAPSSPTHALQPEVDPYEYDDEELEKARLQVKAREAQRLESSDGRSPFYLTSSESEKSPMTPGGGIVSPADAVQRSPAFSPQQPPGGADASRPACDTKPGFYQDVTAKTASPDKSPRGRPVVAQSAPQAVAQPATAGSLLGNLAHLSQLVTRLPTQQARGKTPTNGDQQQQQSAQQLLQQQKIRQLEQQVKLIEQKQKINAAAGGGLHLSGLMAGAGYGALGLASGLQPHALGGAGYPYLLGQQYYRQQGELLLHHQAGAAMMGLMGAAAGGYPPGYPQLSSLRQPFQPPGVTRSPFF